VLLAGLNSARYLKDGMLVEVPGSELFASAIPVPIFNGFSFEGLPNRDSISYIDTYNLDSTKLKTMFRGTLRYKGFSELMYLFSKIGLFDTKLNSEIRAGLSWGELLKRLTNGDMLGKLSQLGVDVNANSFNRLKEAMHSLELDSFNLEVPKENCILDSFCFLLQKKLAYQQNERDMVAMHHEFGIKWSDGRKELRKSTMIVYGDPNGYSAMAKTVGYPAAMATDMILQKQLKSHGVIAPMSSDIYVPLIKKLAQENIKFTEQSRFY
jgi:alpha-aminoadipic semialdehyde synthase